MHSAVVKHLSRGNIRFIGCYGAMDLYWFLHLSILVVRISFAFHATVISEKEYLYGSMSTNGKV